MNNAEYWAKRMEALMKAEMEKADNYGLEVSKTYRKAARSMKDDIAKWYAKFAENNQVSLAEAKKMLRKGELEEFKWTIEEYIEKGRENGIDADWEKQLINASARVHISRLQALRLQCYQHAYEATHSLVDGLRMLLNKIYSSMYYHTAYEIQKGRGQGDPFAKLNTTAVDKIISKPWAADGSDFSSRIWRDKQKLLYELDQVLTQGMIRGDPLDKMSEQLAKRMNVSENRAKAIVESESAHFANQAQSDNFKEFDVKEYEIVAALDTKTCAVCGEMDGKRFKLSEEKPGINAPLFHTRCRCCKSPVSDLDIPGGERAARNQKTNKTYYIPKNMTYKEWKEKYVDSAD